MFLWKVNRCTLASPAPAASERHTCDVSINAEWVCLKRAWLHYNQLIFQHQRCNTEYTEDVVIYMCVCPSARGVSYLFDIQVKTFNSVYDGKDLIGQARTGTGKTFSFAVPLVEKLQSDMEDRRRGRAPKVSLTPHSSAFMGPAANEGCTCHEIRCAGHISADYLCLITKTVDNRFIFTLTAENKETTFPKIIYWM